MSAQRQAEDPATADTVIHPPRSWRAQDVEVEPDLHDTIVPVVAPDSDGEPGRAQQGHTPEPALEPALEHVPATEPTPAEASLRRATAGHYAFRVGDRSEVITLDAPSYIGRRPQPPRIPHTVAPQLVRVDSPMREVSATHVEIRQVGSSIVVRDLATTNGSVVHMPGSVPRTLRQGESIVVSPGTLVDIGDENVIHILPVQAVS